MADQAPSGRETGRQRSLALTHLDRTVAAQPGILGLVSLQQDAFQLLGCPIKPCYNAQPTVTPHVILIIANPLATYDDVCLPFLLYLCGFFSHGGKADVAAQAVRCSVMKATSAGAPRGISYLDTMTNHMHRQDGDREELGILDHRLRHNAFRLTHLRSGTSLLHPAPQATRRHVPRRARPAPNAVARVVPQRVR